MQAKKSGDNGEWDREDDELEDEEDGDIEVELDEDEEDDDNEDEEDEEHETLDAQLPDERDLEVRREFAAAGRAGLGSERLARRLSDPGTTPEVSANDIDADWERADPVGEETVGGTVATPDQDVVEAIGDAVGVTYRDDEPLDPTTKEDRRDRSRWELDPASAADYAERQRELDRGKLEEDEDDDAPERPQRA